MAIKLFAGILICLTMSASVLAVNDGKLRQRAYEALKNGDYENAEKQFRELLAAAGWRLTRVIPTAAPDSIVEAIPA